MLSICIPIYAYDVRQFVQQLHGQAQRLTIPWEILLLDDASPAPWPKRNEELGELEGVSYTLLNRNLGRAAIRNELARRAQYDYLLFLDGDGQVETEHFLSNYVSSLQAARILCGGRTYAPEAPSDAGLYLHWYYGSKREVRSASQRQQQPYLGFMTNNFVVPKRVILQLPFDERITTYGHEDTLFGQALRTAEVTILHLDNPIRHLGLEPAESWLRKQAQAVTNLSRIHHTYPEIDTRLLGWWQQLAGWPIVGKLLLASIGLLTPQLNRLLLNRRPPLLRALDLLKLRWLQLAEEA